MDVSKLFEADGMTKVVAEPAKAAAAPASPPPAMPPPATQPPAYPGKVIDPAKPAEPTVPPTPAPVNNDYLKGLVGGKFQTSEEINKYVTELEAKASAAQENPFVNDYVKGLNQAIKDGIDPEVYGKVAGLETDKLDPREALVLERQFKDKLTREEAELSVDAKYRFGEDEDATSQEVKIARIEAKVQANRAKEFLASHRAEQLTPPREVQLERQSKAWEAITPKMSEEFKVISIDQAKTGKLDFPVSQEVLTAATEKLTKILGDGVIMAMPDEKGMALAKDILKNEILIKSLPGIIDHLRDQAALAAATEHHNPGGLKSNPPPSKGPLTGEDARNEFLAKQHGIKLNHTVAAN